MIKIVRGVYGFKDMDGIVRPKTEADEPFELSAEQEARLVRLGVAEYVGSTEGEQNQETEQDSTEGEQTPVGFDETPPEIIPLSDLNAKELREMGKEYGLTFKVGTTKEDMVNAITAAQNEVDATGDEDDPGEPAPVFDAAEAVL